MIFDADLLLHDAKEMHAILRDATSIKRHFIISQDKLAEILTALVLDGDIADRNSHGYDVSAPAYGKIEVRSRVLGTDGEFPRISLSPTKLQTADSFMAVRWTKEFELFAAILLPKSSVQPLFDARLQSSGRLAHIQWRNWIAAPGSTDFTPQFKDKLAR